MKFGHIKKETFFVNPSSIDHWGYPIISELPLLKLYLHDNFKDVLGKFDHWVPPPEEVLTMFKKLYWCEEYEERKPKFSDLYKQLLNGVKTKDPIFIKLWKTHIFPPTKDLSLRANFFNKPNLKFELVNENHYGMKTWIHSVKIFRRNEVLIQAENSVVYQFGPIITHI